MAKQDVALVKFREIGELCELHKLSPLGDSLNNDLEYPSLCLLIFLYGVQGVCLDIIKTGAYRHQRN